MIFALVVAFFSTMGFALLLHLRPKLLVPACMGGMLSVMDNEVTLIATTFEWAEDIDVSRAERARRRAEELLHKHLETRDLELAQARLKRALTRIQVGK